MRSTTTLRMCCFAASGLLLAACTLIPLSPSLDLVVQSSAYTKSTVDIPYSFATLSRNSNDGSAQCSYSLEKWDPSGGVYQWIDGQDTTLVKKGTLSFPLDSLLGAGSANPAIDGLYKLTFSVLSGNYDQFGNPIPIPYLSKTVTFTVHTNPGPEIFRVVAPMVNVSGSSVTVTLEGLGFVGSDQVTSPSSPSNVSGSVFVDSQTMTAIINTSGLTAGNQLELAIADTASGAVSPSFYLPVVGNVTISSVVPSSGSSSNSRLPLYITGTFLGGWTTVTVTGANGATTTMPVDAVGGSYIFGYLDLTSLSPGAATLTIKNPDGSTASASFAVFN